MAQALREKHLSKTTVQQANAIKDWLRRKNGEKLANRSRVIPMPPRVVKPRVINPEELEKRMNSSVKQPTSAPPARPKPPVQVGSNSFAI